MMVATVKSQSLTDLHQTEFFNYNFISNKTNQSFLFSLRKTIFRTQTKEEFFNNLEDPFDGF